MADLVYPEEHPLIKFIKDLAAGAVLVAAITAVVVGLFIFIPKLK
jgi:diacylglycerol kinase